MHTPLPVDLRYAALDELAPCHFEPVCALGYIALGRRPHRQFDWTRCKFIPQACLDMDELGTAADGQSATLARVPAPGSRKI